MFGLFIIFNIINSILYEKQRKNTLTKQRKNTLIHLKRNRQKFKKLT